MGLRYASSVQGTRGERGEAAESRVLFSNEVLSEEIIVRSYNKESRTKDDRFIVHMLGLFRRDSVRQGQS